MWSLKMIPAALEVAPGNRKEGAAAVDSDIAPRVEVVDKEGAAVGVEADMPAVDKEAGREAADIPREAGPNPEVGYKDFENNSVAADKEAVGVVEADRQNKIRNSGRPGLHMKTDYYNLDNKNIAAF
jgi:hypothetical protein